MFYFQHHHQITTTIGIRHVNALKPTSIAQHLSDSLSSTASSETVNINPGYYANLDSDVRKLLESKKYKEAIDTLNARYVSISQGRGKNTFSPSFLRIAPLFSGGFLKRSENGRKTIFAQ